MAAPVKLTTKPEYCDGAAAVSLAIALLRKAKANTWATFVASAQAQEDTAITAVQAFDLTEAQISLLANNQQYLDLMTITPMALPTFCDTCGTISLQAGTTVKKCINTRECAGAMYKPAAATRS